MSTDPASDYNFSRVSGCDAIAFGSARPGYPSEEATLPLIEQWSIFMESKGIKRVLSLLGDDEKDFYKDIDIDDAMIAQFGQGNYTRTSVFKDGARQILSDALTAAREANEPIVMHCSGGGGRAALAMGVWLVDTYGIAPEDAAKEVQEEADRTEGVKRKMKAAKLAHLVVNGSMLGF